MEELVVYLRKEYFRAVDLTDKSGHILEFKYMPKTVDVYEKGLSVFHMEYVMENRTKVRVIEILPDRFRTAWERLWNGMYE